MQLNLYSTLNKKTAQIKPLHEGKIGLYACGFTVYDYTHLGHLRKYTMDDVLIRALRYGNAELGEKIGMNLAPYEVTFVQNVTDVGHLASDADTGEDKLEKGAKKYGKSVWDIAHEFEEYFFKSMDLMGNLRPDVSCRATEHIEEQLNMVLELEKKGFTYVIENDGVYFDTSKFPEYGKMAGLHLDDQEEGARIGAVEGKRNPSDFALWKFERTGENRAMVWPSPWNERSFPGWHIECSAMAMKYLGEQFDIHTGGIDHIPVHHTNEIAQAEAVTGKQPFVNYWVHHNHLHINSEKMSKSLGNFYTIDDLKERGFKPLALRLLFLTAHYQSEMNFTWDNLAGAQKSYDRLLKQFAELHSSQSLERSQKASPEERELSKKQAIDYGKQFFDVITNNLNTPQAVSILWAVVKDLTLLPEEKHSLLLEFDKILGLGLKTVDRFDDSQSVAQVSEEFDLPQEISELIEQRIAARKNKNYEESDRLRDLLLEKGYEVTDWGSDKYSVKKVAR
ncbi:cysteine--tRNA ligase [Candidatus Woesebacteria bacterium]|nr:cysteine--tRNA ligase [Candidatus Woesebacteria bacterium]